MFDAQTVRGIVGGNVDRNALKPPTVTNFLGCSLTDQAADVTLRDCPVLHT